MGSFGLLFVFFTLCILVCGITILPESCPEGEVPSKIKFPVGGKTGIQVQIDNPDGSLLQSRDVTLFAWFLYDENQGIRIDFPNPEIFIETNESSFPFPILLSLFIPVNNDVGKTKN